MYFETMIDLELTDSDIGFLVDSALSYTEDKKALGLDIRIAFDLLYILSLHLIHKPVALAHSFLF